MIQFMEECFQISKALVTNVFVILKPFVVIKLNLRETFFIQCNYLMLNLKFRNIYSLFVKTVE